MSATRKPQRTKTPSKMKASPVNRSQPKVAVAGDELTPSSGELASTLGNRGAGLLESHHHVPGGHGPDPDGAEVVDPAGDLHSDDRDVDDNEDAVEAAVGSKTAIADVENLAGLRDEEIVEGGSFLDEPATSSDPWKGSRLQRHQTA